MINWTKLTQWHSAPLTNAIKDLEFVSSGVATVQQNLSDTEVSGTSWSGQAATAAQARINEYGSALLDLDNEINQLVSLLQDSANKVDDVVEKVNRAENYAASYNLTIGNETIAGPGLLEIATIDVQAIIEELQRLINEAMDAAKALTEFISTSDVFRGLRDALVSVLNALIQDEIAKRIAKMIQDSLDNVFRLQLGAVAIPVSGPLVTRSIPVHPEYIRNAGRIGGRLTMGVGTLFDFHNEMQDVHQGKQTVGDAVIKTAAHTGIGVGSAAIAGAAIGSIIPGAGTAVGLIGGAVIGGIISVAGSALFDAGYDHIRGID